jgi:predicted transposase/invertase (TIGR01784 family)
LRRGILLETSWLEGHEKGIEKGIKKGKFDVAQRLIDKGMSLEEAAEVAGVSVEVLRGGV